MASLPTPPRHQRNSCRGDPKLSTPALAHHTKPPGTQRQICRKGSEARKHRACASNIAAEGGPKLSTPAPAHQTRAPGIQCRTCRRSSEARKLAQALQIQKEINGILEEILEILKEIEGILKEIDGILKEIDEIIEMLQENQWNP